MTAAAVAEPRADRRVDTRAVIGAMSKTGAGAIASGLFAALGTKIVAVVLGPAAVAIVATLQQVHTAALNAATLNGQTALVQGASALRSNARREFLATAATLMAIAGALTALAMIAAPQAIARMAGLGVGRAGLIRWLVIPVVLSSVYTFVNALLRARGEVGKLAAIQTMAAAAAATVAWPAAMAASRGNTSALVAMLASSAAVGAIASAGVFGRGDLEWLRARLSSEAVRHFFKISAAVLVSGLTGPAVLLALRSRITRESGAAVTGEFDAAWAISMTHVTLILASMRVYFLPLVARAESVGERRDQIANVLRVSLAAATPIIVAIALGKPLVLSILYSAAFHPAGAYLRWTLVGDYLKVASTVLATPMLACGDMGAFLAADCATQATFLGAAWLIGSVRGPAEGAAIGFVISYAVDFTLCMIYARRRHGLRLGWGGRALFLGGLGVSALACWVGA